MLMNHLFLVFVLLALAPGLAAQGQPPPATQAPPTESQPAVDADLHPRIKLETTLGNIVLELDAEKAPITVGNFVTYVEAGYYNGTIFHRVIPTFMIQGGGFTPDFKEKKEGQRPPIRNEWKNGLKNLRGTIAMARTQVHDSATSQFFINVKDNPPLDLPRDGAAYAVFGKVVEGLDVVDQIKDVETRVDPQLEKMYEEAKAASRPAPEPQKIEKSQPVDPPVIKSAKLLTKFDHAKVKQRLADAAAALRAAEEKELQDAIQKIEAETGQKVQKTPSGLMYVILKEGTGPRPKPTDKVEVHYTGWLTNGTKFESSVDSGKPIEFSLRGGVIKGWLEGVGLMKVGEKRKLIIPYQLGYGEAGRPPAIPPKATLIFDVELLAIK
jgi:peptidyl-prolyl cis-trans isomerase A (cyclophilin A)